MKYNREIILTLIISLCTSSAVLAQVSEKTPGWYAFPVVGIDSVEGTPLDVSFLNSGPAASRISVSGSHFVDEAGKRVRFLGTNVTFSGAFPEKEDAPAIARRMAQLGMNVVRFHHMDARDIWLPGQQEFDPQKVDQLDWFIHQLKRNGIYTNINLHVSRTYPGLKELDAARTYRYGKVLDSFYEPYIRLQEHYARNLLGHVNPYTKLRLADDPAVAFVEINNENTLLHLTPSSLNAMPKVHRRSLEKQWQTWLAARYSTLTKAFAAWNSDVIPLGPEMVRDQRFEKGLAEWRVEGKKPGVCDAEAVNLPDGVRAAKITMNAKGKVAWAYQFHQLGVALQEGTTYTFRFRAKADPARSVSTALRFSQAPWTTVGAQQSCNLTKDWQEFVIVSTVKGIDPQKAFRMSLNLGDAPGTVWIANVSLRSGKERFKPSGITELNDVPLPSADWPDLTWADFRRFLIETEQNYVKRVKAVLKDEIGVKSLIVDTQASYGGYWGLQREASISDYIDMHAYWQHPHFPGKPWDGNNWYIPNESMVAASAGSTFERLAHYRFEGLPYSVSEYNHPAPNDHAAELFPLLSAFAAHQDWDALYQFCYANRQESLRQSKIEGYFGLSYHPGQLAFLPIAALAFRQELIPAAANKAVLTVPLELMDKSLALEFPDYRDLAGTDVVPDQVVYGSRFSTQLSRTGTSVSLSSPRQPSDDSPYIDSPSLFWNPKAEHPVFTVSAPAVKMAVGDIVGRPLKLGDVTVAVDKRNIGPWACVALAARDGKSLADSSSMLLSVATRVENSNMGWNKERTSVGRKWGSSPVVAQTVLTTITLPGKTKPGVAPLSPKGKRLASLKVTGTPGAWTVKTSADTPSLWYAIER